jgi:NO-binding membrane sensor protein with MHYT domain/nitrogen-specific signal transduction histidine kinase
MLRVIYSCIADQHDLRLVVLAGCLCLFACFTATNLFVHAAEARGRPRSTWLAGAACVFGSGVWATHFVAELAYRPGVPVGYDTTLTILSIVVAMAISWLGMAIALRYRMLEIGGAIIGAAVGAMHYVGMAALRVPADLHWNFAYVGVSIAIGICFAAAAMHMLSRGTAMRYRAAATGLLVLAIVGLHFTAMAAVTLELDPAIAMSGAIIEPGLLAIAVAAVTVLIVALGLSGSIVDRQLAERAVQETERLQRRVDERTAELRQVQDELLREERLTALGQLMASMAHELRNPLSAISNTLYTIKEAVANSDLDLARPIGRMERSIGRCERIIGDLLNYSRLRELRRKSWPLDSWLGALLDRQKLPEGVTLSRRFEAPGIHLSFDDEMMRQAVANLLENAIHAVVEPDIAQRLIAVATHAVGDGFEIAIEDTGTGMPSEVLAKVFEPLFSTKAFGAGLGLPMVKQIVEQHGGTVEIASEPGRYTRVAIRLPLAIPATTSIAA